MTFKYRSPIDKSINVGGLGSVSSFNEFGGNFPPYGTFLYSVDTSHSENDATGTPFFMPYTTNFYANGQGGEFSQEVWGLQYYPAGWVGSITTNTAQESYSYTTSDNTVVAQTVDVSTETFWNTEDGTGINTPISQGVNYLVIPYQIVQELFDGYAYRWFVDRNASNNGWDFHDYTMYPSYGTNLGQTTDNAQMWINEINNYVTAGTNYYDTLADGYGGSFSSLTNTYWAYGETVLATWDYSDSTSYDGVWTHQSYTNGTWNETRAVMDGPAGTYGNGTYSVVGFSGGSYYAQGTNVVNLSTNPNYVYWDTYQFEDGTGYEENLQWDGMGGFQNSGGQPYGTYYQANTYIGQFYNNGDYITYDLYWDGYGGIWAYPV